LSYASDPSTKELPNVWAVPEGVNTADTSNYRRLSRCGVPKAVCA